jgi:pilus assembly protein FimV
MGLGIDPENPLYQPGGATASTLGALTAEADGAGSANSTIAMPTATASEPAAMGMDLDLDLDFSADEEPSAHAPAATEDTVKIQNASSVPTPNDGIDFDISSHAELTPSASLPEESPSADVSGTSAMTAMAKLSEPLESVQGPLEMDGLNLLDNTDTSHIGSPEFLPTGTLDLKATPNPEPPNPSDGLLEFDLTSLSLDLDGPAESVGASLTGEDPLETKLALAEEFVSIGDHDGARALIEEVVGEATGELRAKAERALANLG